MVEAIYFDGQSARAWPVRLSANAGQLQLASEALTRQYAVAEVRLSERLGSAARRLDFADGSHCEVRDHAAFDQLLREAGLSSRWVERAQRSLPFIATSLLTLVLLAGAFYRWGLPWVAVKAAERVTPDIAELLATQTLELLDDRYLKPSTLDAARQQQLRQRARAFGDNEALLFRHGELLGANALTLPDGRIVLLDELVALADNDEQILAVLGHELGHATGRHGLRLLIRNTVVSGLAAWWFGDVSQLLVVGPTLLLNTEYSRTLEQEADAHAIALLKAQGISPRRLAEMLRKLETAHGEAGKDDPRWLRYLSTHPDTAARIADIEAAAGDIRPAAGAP